MPKLLSRYERITAQLDELFVKVTDPVSRMASAAALVHAKFSHHSWTGFYRLLDGDLIVGPYQGPLACMLLERDQGVCWASANRRETVIVPDVHAFAGHIACDPRSASEVVVPVFDASGELRAVLDVDSEERDAFDEEQAQGLALVASRIYG